MSSERAEIAVLRLGGPRLAYTECDQMKEMFNQLLRAGQVRIALDFSDVEFMDSTMIGTLVASVRRVNSFEGRVAICNLSAPLERLIAILKLEGTFLVCKSVEEAREKLGA
ncbi:STAS domain-containing protein [bacterium]|nr:STAS domain-containing protein [bacterium]